MVDVHAREVAMNVEVEEYGDVMGVETGDIKVIKHKII
jgi:hypothetical protein